MTVKELRKLLEELPDFAQQYEVVIPNGEWPAREIEDAFVMGQVVLIS